MTAWANLLRRRHKRLKEWRKLQNIEPFACDHHHPVSFAKAWMLMSQGVALALDFDFMLVQPALMAPLQRRLEGGLRQTLSALFVLIRNAALRCR